MPNQSTLIGHPQQVAIDAALAGGMPLRAVGRSFGVGYAAVQRYVAKGNVPQRQATSATRTVPDGAGHAEVLREALDGLRDMDPSRMAPAAQVARIDAIRRAAESLGKIEPAPASPTLTVDAFMEVQMENGRTVGDWFRTLMDVLEPYPEVRDRIVERLKAEDSARTPA